MNNNKIEFLDSTPDAEYASSMDLYDQIKRDYFDTLYDKMKATRSLIEEPKSQMAQDFKKLLDSMSQEEFNKEWAEITSKELEGESLLDFAKCLGERINEKKLTIEKLDFDMGLAEVIEQYETTMRYFFNKNCGMPRTQAENPKYNEFLETLHD